AATLTSAPLPTAGVAIRFHLVPVRCKIIGLRYPIPPDEPTAQSSPPTAVTAVRSPREGRAAMFTVAQTRPFQWASMGRPELPNGTSPTAHASSDAFAATPSTMPCIDK